VRGAVYDFKICGDDTLASAATEVMPARLVVGEGVYRSGRDDLPHRSRLRSSRLLH
jgi:hypothetical protein